MLYVFCNGFWDGFQEETDGIHFGFFKKLLNKVFATEILITKEIASADILLETHFMNVSYIHSKLWKCSIFFCGEGSRQVPNLPYNIILGSHGLQNFVPCPLGLIYEYCKPSLNIPNVPFNQRKGICAVITSDAGHHEKRERAYIIDKFIESGFQIDFGGRYRNNLGYTVNGNYFSQELLDFYSKYKIVLAFENSVQNYYITEKVINAMANSIALYFGSPKIAHFIPREKILLPDDIDEIKKVLSNEDYFNEKLNNPRFLRPLDVFITETANKIKCLLSNLFFPVMISKIAVEKRSHELIKYYNIEPTYTVWSKMARLHSYWKKFLKTMNQNQISLAINHIGIFETYKDCGKYLLVLESDATLLQDKVEQVVQLMKEHNIDFVFVGVGCFPNLDIKNFRLSHYSPECCFNINLANPIGEILYQTNTSRCTEAYIVSPKGMQKYLEYFYNTENHNTIDFDFNNFFYQTKTASYWAIPELFYQDPSYISNINTTADL